MCFLEGIESNVCRMVNVIKATVKLFLSFHAKDSTNFLYSLLHRL